MINLEYWKKYLYETDAKEIENNIKKLHFSSLGETLELTYFEKSKNAPNILFITATGDHPYVYAELGYNLFLKGFNVFVIPTIDHDFRFIKIVDQVNDAAKYISENYNDKVGVIGASMGGLVAMYVALSNGKAKSIVAQDPGIVTEEAFRSALFQKGISNSTLGERLFPFGNVLARIFPKFWFPTKLYLNFKTLIDSNEEMQRLDTYFKDPDIVHWYTISALLSMISTPPLNPLSQLKVPIMFFSPVRDKAWSREYIKGLYNRLPSIKKKFIEVDGGHYFMLSHPRKAAELIGDWFRETLV